VVVALPGGASALDGVRVVVERLAAEKTTAEWERLCAEHSIPFSPVLDIEKVTEDPYSPRTVRNHVDR
jgi:crotonobetainyl-CoA:carnitine CoA-transferase CaiB-like acyl-CoA transferase